jgi:hypothetical protein
MSMASWGKIGSEETHSQPRATVIRVGSEQTQVVVVTGARMGGLETIEHLHEEPESFTDQVLEHWTELARIGLVQLGISGRYPDGHGLVPGCHPYPSVLDGTSGQKVEPRRMLSFPLEWIGEGPAPYRVREERLDERGRHPRDVRRPRNPIVHDCSPTSNSDLEPRSGRGVSSAFSQRDAGRDGWDFGWRREWRRCPLPARGAERLDPLLVQRLGLCPRPTSARMRTRTSRSSDGRPISPAGGWSRIVWARRARAAPLGVARTSFTRRRSADARCCEVGTSLPPPRLRVRVACRGSRRWP